MRDAGRSNSSERAIHATGLTKHFGDTKAVDGVDLTVPAGMVYGLLGPNGAGKTTIIRMLATLLKPTAGSATVFGHDIVGEADAVRGRVSLTGQFASVDEDLTGIENLVLIGRLLGFSSAAARRRGSELLDAFDIADAADRQVKRYSGGMRRRLDIAASIVVTPDLIFLDEPTTGLDPRSRNGVWDIVRALVSGGTTVLLTTQYLEEADQLADRIAVIEHGRLVAEGTSTELKASVGAGTIRVRVADGGRRDEAHDVLVASIGGGVERDADATGLTARSGDAARAAEALAALTGRGIEVAEFSLGQPTLDEVFLAITGHPARDESQHDRDESEVPA